MYCFISRPGQPWRKGDVKDESVHLRRPVDSHCGRWFFRGGPVISSAISGIEQAMWDIFGKFLGLPVYQLLGGACRKNIRVYSNLFTYEYNVEDKSPEDYANNALKKIKQGFTAIKFAIPYSKKILDNKDHINYCSSIMGSIREAVGNSIDIIGYINTH